MRTPKNFACNICDASTDKLYILPNGETFDFDPMKTRLNNNVMVIGGSGSSKTRGVVIPNTLAATGSYIISDPKGSIFRKYSGYMQKRGYNVIHLDFIHPDRSDGYNMFDYVESPNDILKLAHYMVYAGKNSESIADPFWDSSSEILLSSLIGSLIASGIRDKSNIAGITELLTMIDAQSLEAGGKCKLDYYFDKLCLRTQGKNDIAEWSRKQFNKFRQTPPKTLNCILTTLQGTIGNLDTPEINQMMLQTTIEFEKLGTEKTVVFVEVSDTDRSKDILINTFYTQAINALCTFADERCENSSLPVPVRFFLDDFGTNCKIEGFENMISNIRSRNISALIVLQSESQLMKGYGFSAHTIIDNCDTLIYMGGNDVDTATTIAKRANKPLSRILDMPVGTNWVFRRGEKPRYSRTIDIDEYTMAAIIPLEYTEDKMYDEITFMGELVS